MIKIKQPLYNNCLEKQPDSKIVVYSKGSTISAKLFTWITKNIQRWPGQEEKYQPTWHT